MRKRRTDSSEKQAKGALPGAVGADDRGDLAFVQIERRAGHRIVVVPAVTMDEAACGDGDRSERALLALDRSAARPSRRVRASSRERLRGGRSASTAM